MKIKKKKAPEKSYMEDKDEVQSRSESSPSKEPSYQEPLVEENLMKIESNTNNPSSPLIEKEKQS